jgi:hypothetical protein
VIVNSFVTSYLYDIQYGSLYYRKSPIKISSKVWIEDAEEGFVDDDENLMTGEVCLKSIKAFAQDITTDNCYQDDDAKRFLGAAALVQRPTSSNFMYDCWIADAFMDETNVQFKGAIMLLDHLFLFHLQRMMKDHKQSFPFYNIHDVVSSFIVQCGHPDSEYHCASYMAALYRGFKPLKDMVYFDDRKGQHVHNYTYLEHLDLYHENLDALVFDMSSIAAEDYLSKDDIHQNERKQIHDIIMQGLMDQEQSSAFQ